MADTKISAMTDGGTPAAGDAFVIARSGQNFRLGPLRLDALVTAAPPTASVNFNAQRITNLGTPTLSTDAATKAYVDSSVVSGAAAPLSSVLAVGNDAGAASIVNLGVPVLETDAATKGYVDSFSFRVISATAYTIRGPNATATDQGLVISCTSGSGCTVSFDSDANTGWPTFNASNAQVVYIRQFGGTVTVQGINGALVESRGSIFTLAGPFAWVTAVRVGPNLWELFGDLG